jgi:hypothetical protein
LLDFHGCLPSHISFCLPCFGAFAHNVQFSWFFKSILSHKRKTFLTTLSKENTSTNHYHNTVIISILSHLSQLFGLHIYFSIYGQNGIILYIAGCLALCNSLKFTSVPD